MYKKEIMGNNNKEHLFSPPLSFAPPLPWGAFFCLTPNQCESLIDLSCECDKIISRKYDLAITPNDFLANYM